MNTFPEKLHFLVLFQVLQMGNYRIGSLFDHDFHDLGFIVGLRFSFFNGNGSLGTMSQAGSQSVAHQITDKPGFTIDHLKCSLVTGGDTLTASVT